MTLTLIFSIYESTRSIREEDHLDVQRILGGGIIIHRRYTITELTQMFDITPRTLRYYEEVGLIQPERRGVHRIYRDRDRVRLQLILRGKRLGFSLPEIADMLSLYDADSTEVTQLRDVIRRGDQKLREIEAQIRDLQTIRDELLELRSRMQKTLNEKLGGEREG